MDKWDQQVFRICDISRTVDRQAPIHPDHVVCNALVII